MADVTLTCLTTPYCSRIFTEGKSYIGSPNGRLVDVRDDLGHTRSIPVDTLRFIARNDIPGAPQYARFKEEVSHG